MAFINTNARAGFDVPVAQSQFEPVGDRSYASAFTGAPASDSLARTVLPPIVVPPTGGPNSGVQDSFAGTSSLSSIFGSIMQTLSNLMAQLASYFGNANGGGSYGSSSSPQTFFSNAAARSVGDPHDSLHGSTGSGSTIDSHWDSMTGHADLLDSDSFRGGYRVATTATAPSANGVTYNQSATVATHDGNDTVTLNGDGSYAVNDHGSNLTLTPGQTLALGRNETVTLNADRSLTIADSNATGGTITTTLKTNGHGVDVDASATGVDLGGYLVNRADHAPIAPVRYGSAGDYGLQAEPLGAGEIEFA